MIENALITISTLQYDEFGEEDIIELVTRGRYAEKAGKQYISYEESGLTGFEGSTTTIKIDGNHAILKRKGRHNSKMEFELGVKRPCKYPTPYGEIQIQSKLIELENNLTENGGDAKLIYLLDIENMTMRNELTLNVVLKSFETPERKDI